MNIELKYGFKQPLTVVCLSVLALFFGALAISYRIAGLVMIPFVSGCIAFLMCTEKKRIASIAVSAILIIGEILYSLSAYYTPSVLTSVAVATVIALHYLKKKEKCDSALFTTLIIAVAILASGALYLLGTTDASSLSEAYEYFLAAYDSFKEDMIASIVSISASSDNATLSTEYMNEVFNAYLNCLVGICGILAFLISGLSHKAFGGLVTRYEKSPKPWHFIPATPFAYFYATVAILSMFTTDTTSVIDVSVANLYLIFMFVFAYAGFSFSVFVLNQKRKRTAFTPLAIIAICVLFSSIAVQILAVVGAFATIYRAKLIKNDGTSV